MTEIQDRLKKTLHDVAIQLRDVGLSALSTQTERLAEQAAEQCVVAVVGRINAGKSSFINALLGEDLATVGPTETTATINYFRYGPEEADWAVHCHWRDGQVTMESRQFLDDLQNTSIEALQKSSTIAYLEYWLQNQYLKGITLVDTPGTNAIAAERQRRTEIFLDLFRQKQALTKQGPDYEAMALSMHEELQQVHQRETLLKGSEADAIIYMIGETPEMKEKAFLDEFQHVTQGQARAWNAIGVMTKIDLIEELIQQRETLAADVARQLQSELKKVIPVSASLHLAMKELLASNGRGLKQIIKEIRPLSPETIDDLLTDPEAYLDVVSSIPPERWRHLRGEMPWSVFNTIVRVVANHPTWDERRLAEELQAIAGFKQVDETLRRYFIRRGSYLRSSRIVKQALDIRDNVRFEELDKFRRLDEANKAKRERFLSFIQQGQHDAMTARELEQFIKDQLYSRAEKLQPVIDALEAINDISIELEIENQDFEALLLTEEHPELFGNLLNPMELDELRRLLGADGTDISERVERDKTTQAYIEDQQSFWNDIYERAAEDNVRMVARCAVRRYGLIGTNLTGTLTW